MRPTLLLALALAPYAPGQEPSFEEKLLAKVPEGYTTYHERKSRFGEEYRVHLPVRWSPMGDRVAYVALQGEEFHPTIGDEVGDSRAGCEPPVFSPDGASVAFRVYDGRSAERTVVGLLVDGVQVDAGVRIGELAYSDDGEALAYWIKHSRGPMDLEPAPQAVPVEDQGQVFSLARRTRNGWEIQRTAEPWVDGRSEVPPVFVAGTRTAVSVGATLDKGWILFGFDGRKTKPLLERRYEESLGFTMDRKGKSFAFAYLDQVMYLGHLAERQPTWRPESYRELVWHDGEVHGKGYSAASHPVLSPSGRHVAMCVRKHRSLGVAVGDEEVECEYTAIHGMTFDPRGRRLAYVANQNGRERRETELGLLEPGLKGGETFVVIREVHGGSAEQQGRYGAISHLVWSPDGRRLAYCGKDGDSWRVIVDGEAGPAYDEVGPPVFSRKGDQVAHGARIGDELWWKVREVE